MSKELGISVRKLQRILNDMDDIEYVGHGKTGHWEIRS